MSPRHDAASAGRTRYFTGEPCRNGHIAERFVSSGGCIECVAGANRSVRGLMRAARPEAQPGPGALTRVIEYVHPDDMLAVRQLCAAFRASSA